MMPKLRSICLCLVTAGAASTALPVLAQSGTLRYSPNVNAVPVGSTVMYIALALLLAVLGVVVMRRQQGGSTLSGFSVLTLVGALAIAQFWVASEVYARVSGVTLFMSNAAGGTLVIQDGTQTVSNTSGVPLVITRLTPPCAALNLASNRCSTGLFVDVGDSCNIDYTCPTP